MLGRAMVLLLNQVHTRTPHREQQKCHSSIPQSVIKSSVILRTRWAGAFMRLQQRRLRSAILLVTSPGLNWRRLAHTTLASRNCCSYMCRWQVTRVILAWAVRNSPRRN